MFLAPAGTPQDIVDRLAAEAAKAMKDEALRKRLAEQAVVPVGATPADTAKFLQSEIDKWEKVITTAGVKVDSEHPRLALDVSWRRSNRAGRRRR